MMLGFGQFKIVILTARGSKLNVWARVATNLGRYLRKKRHFCTFYGLKRPSRLAKTNQYFEWMK